MPACNQASANNSWKAHLNDIQWASELLVGVKPCVAQGKQGKIEKQHG